MQARHHNRPFAAGLRALPGLVGLLAGACAPPPGPAGGPAAVRYGLDLPLSAAPAPGAPFLVPDSVSVGEERWTLYSLGLQEEYAGRFGEALDYYERASRRWPRDPELLIRRSICQRELRHPNEALTLAEEALAIDSLHVEALWMAATNQAALGRSAEALQTAARLARLGREPRAHRLRANVLARLGRTTEALAELDTLVGMNPDAPHLLEQRAELRMKIGRVEEALADYWEIFMRAPEYPGIVDTLAAALGRLGRDEELIRLYRVLVERHPLQARVRWRLVELLLAHDRWDEGEMELERLRELRPGDGLPVLQLGLVAFRRGDSVRALELIDQAHGLEADPTQVWTWKMRIHFSERDYPEALAAADTLTRIEPRKAEGWRIRALCLADSGLHEDALEAVAVWAALEETSAEPLMLGAAICRETDQPARGLELIEQARRRTPGDQAVELEYAAHLEAMDRVAEAEGIAQGILDQDPVSAPALNFLGYLWVDLGVRLSEAEGLIRQALEIDPENPAYLDSMGWLWYKRGDLEQAGEWLRQAIDKGGRHPEIFVHLARVDVDRGRIREARETLAAGLQSNPGAHDLREFLLSLEGRE